MEELKKQNSYDNLKFYLVTLVIGTLFYGLNQWAYFSCDDYFYSVKHTWDTDHTTYSSINSIGDIIQSQTHDYFHKNGRFITHALAQFFAALVDFEWFKVINSCVFCIFIMVLYRLFIKGEHKIFQYFILVSSIWLFLPMPGISIMGNIACSLNYLWAITAFFILYYIYTKVSITKASPYLYVPLFLVGAIVGSLQESISIGFAGAFFFYFLFNHNKLNKGIAFLLAGFFIGTAISVLSPGNFDRQSESGGFILHTDFLTQSLTNLAILIFIFTLIIGFLRNKTKLRKYINDNIILSLAIIFNIIFCLFIGYTGRHQLTCISLCCIFISFSYWRQNLCNANRKVIVIFTSVIVVVSYYFAFTWRKELYDIHESMISEAKATGILDDTAYLDAIRNRNAVKKYLGYTECYNYRGWPIEYESLYFTNGKDKHMLKFVDANRDK